MQQFEEPKKRLRPFFELLSEVSQSAEEALFTLRLPSDESHRRLVMFDAGVLLRAGTGLKAIRLLCEQAHWEYAAAILRQLFELVINARPAGHESACRRLG